MKPTLLAAIAMVALLHGARSARAECVRLESTAPAEVSAALVERLTDRGLLVDPRCPRIATVSLAVAPGDLHLALHDGIGPDRTLDASSVDHAAAFIEAWSALVIVEPRTAPPSPLAQTLTSPPGVAVAPGIAAPRVQPNLSVTRPPDDPESGTPIDLDAGLAMFAASLGDSWPMLTAGLCVRAGGTCIGPRGHVTMESADGGHLNGVDLEARVEHLYPDMRVQGLLAVGLGDYERPGDGTRYHPSDIATTVTAGVGLSIPIAGKLMLVPSVQLGYLNVFGADLGMLTAQLAVSRRSH